MSMWKTKQRWHQVIGIFVSEVLIKAFVSGEKKKVWDLGTVKLVLRVVGVGSMEIIPVGVQGQ